MTARQPLPRDVIFSTPFIRITPSGKQASFGRDALVALNWPSLVTWAFVTPIDPQDLRLRVTECKDVEEDVRRGGKKSVSQARRVTYCGTRPTALLTIPAELRICFHPGRYVVDDYGVDHQGRHWIDVKQSSLIRPRRRGE